jgi:hypothetical protein
VSLLGLLRLSFRPRRLLGPLHHKRIVFRRATARGCIRRQAAHPRRHVRDMLAYGPTSSARGEREDCKAEERQFNRVGRFHLASISADCGIRRTAPANPCHPAAVRIRFPLASGRTHFRVKTNQRASLSHTPSTKHCRRVSCSVLGHTARHEASDLDGITFNHRHRPDHRSTCAIRHCD